MAQKLIARAASLLLPPVVMLFSWQPISAALDRDGRYLVDSSGEEVLLRGMGLGGWLVPEGYMLHIPGYGSPSSIQELITDLLGVDDTEEFYRIYRSNYVNETDIELISQWGFNSIRLPFHYAVLTPPDQPGVYLEEGFNLIDSLLAWCEQREMYLILDMHCAPGGQNPGNISDSDGEARLWTEVENQNRTVAVWREIAERYAGEEWIGGYDLLNEPVLPSGVTTQDMRELYIRITAAIREVDSTHLIFVEGNWYATDITDLAPPWDDRLVYSFHKYWNDTSRETIESYLHLRSAFNHPLWMGEAGENSNPWFHRSVALLESEQVGWCWWTHKKVGTITSPLSAPLSAAYQQVLDYWGGQAPRPSQEVAREALFGMATSLAVDSCELHPDVLAALFDTNFSVVARPFTDHAIPGVIRAIEYDLGDEGVAYHDNDYIKTRFDADQPWNKGWEFRNDGVDIELHDNIYNVGWIEAGEWLSYTISTTTAGVFDIQFEVASPYSDGRLSLSVDGQPLTGELAVPNTGGWHTWQIIEQNDVSLPAGEQQLKLEFPAGNLNIRQITFTGDENSINSVAETYALIRPNYPNPFNTSTTFSFTLFRAGHVVIELFDLQGRPVQTVLDGHRPAGNNLKLWKAHRLASGPYFYSLTTADHRQTRKLLLLK